MEFQHDRDVLDLNLLAPFYFRIDDALKIKEAGKSLRKIFPALPGSDFQEVLELVRPWNIDLSFQSLKDFSQVIFILKFKSTGMMFRGQVIYLKTSNSILFLGSPWLSNTDQLSTYKISITDFSLSDPTTDLIQLIKQNEISMMETRELNELLTEQKRNLEKKEQLYRSLVENASDIIIRCDQEGYLSFVNQATMDITGYDMKELLGRKLFDLVEFSKRSSVEEIFRSNQQSKDGKLHLEFPIVSRQHKEIWLSMSLIAWYEHGRILGYSAIAVDISSRKEIELSMEFARKKAEESSRLKEQFLANTSHEIRTPMNAIVGLSKLLQKTSLQPKQQEYLNAIMTSAENLLVVINDILDFSKIESEKIELEHIPFSIRELWTTLYKSIQIKAVEKNLHLLYSIAPEVENVLCGDPFRYNQILMNITSNAIKFTEQGNVEIEVYVKEQTDEYQWIACRIKDTGIGIPADKLESIFDEFSQADSSTSRKFGGTGLGLSISRKLAELMKGEISIQSTPGKGTEFCILLPFQRPLHELPASPVLQPDAASLKDKQVLLVEDNEFNQMLAISILEGWNMKVSTASNGREAISKLASGNAYDFILMDIQMPEMGGIEATRVIRQQLQIQSPVIALTANAMKSEVDSYFKEGMDACVTKPFNTEDLLRVLVDCLVRA
ncbi:MAG: ATP-binding protein [Cytophagaceae bacterium]|jgi:PAS domain S-box-containing protein|nr:ATP-binding protein [Cytophagaceae bacterium]